MALTEQQKDKVVKVGQLEKFLANADLRYASKDSQHTIGNGLFVNEEDNTLNVACNVFTLGYDDPVTPELGYARLTVKLAENGGISGGPNGLFLLAATEDVAGAVKVNRNNGIFLNRNDELTLDFATDSDIQSLFN